MSYISELSFKNVIRDILNALRYPGWFDRSIQRLRGTTLVESGTITTVTTVTTCTGLTNIDTYQGKLVVINANTAAWALVARARIS